MGHAISRNQGRGLVRKAALAAVVLAPALGIWGSADASRETRSAPRAQASPPAAVDRSPATPLDLYVRAPDPVYGYRPVSEIEAPGCRAYVLELTSGEWRSPDEVDHPLWKHWMTVYVPASVEHRTALISIGGGRSTDPPPKKAHADLARIAAATRSIVVHLQQVPNQPLLFAGEKEPRREDALIAYAWDRYLRTGDATWVPRLPMTRAVVRAMDAATDFCAHLDPAHAIDGFVAAGSSKRGWTVWTVAAVDPRIVAIVPMVIDLLNVEASFENHYRSYGAWSPAIQEFVDLGIPAWLGMQRFLDLRRIEDPYLYRRRLTLPKLVVNATGDPFFLPDSSRFYFDDLSGEKHLRYVPNADHSLNDTDVYDTVQAFYQEVLDGKPRPAYAWKFKGGASIQLRTDPERPPSEVRLWQATNPEGRDFRMSSIGAGWTSTPLAPRRPGLYIGEIEKPRRGWKAFFLELTYRDGSGGRSSSDPANGSTKSEGPSLKVTTAVRIIPDTLPYAWPPKVGSGAPPSLPKGGSVSPVPPKTGSAPPPHAPDGGRSSARQRSIGTRGQPRSTATR